MSKRFTKLIAAFAATMTMLPASAQVMPENQGVSPKTQLQAYSLKHTIS